ELERFTRQGPTRCRQPEIELARAQKRSRGRMHVAAFVLNEAEIIKSFGIFGMTRCGFLDQRGGLVDVADLVKRAAHQEQVVRILERPEREALGQCGRLLELALAKQGVELQKQGIDELVVVV